VAAVAILGDQAGLDAVDRFRVICAFSAICFLAWSIVMRLSYEEPAAVTCR